MKRYLLVFLFLLMALSDAHAKFIFQHSFFYFADTDGGEHSKRSQMNNHFYAAGSLDNEGKSYIGVDYNMWNKSLTPSSSVSASTKSLTEIGPRFEWFFDQNYSHYFALAWHPYEKGTRVIAGGTSNKVSGSGFLFCYGYQIKVSKAFYLGLSINYLSYSMTESISGTTVSTVSESNSTIMPMLEYSLRF